MLKFSQRGLWQVWAHRPALAEAWLAAALSLFYRSDLLKRGGYVELVTPENRPAFKRPCQSLSVSRKSDDVNDLDIALPASGQ